MCIDEAGCQYRRQETYEMRENDLPFSLNTISPFDSSVRYSHQALPTSRAAAVALSLSVSAMLSSADSWDSKCSESRSAASTWTFHGEDIISQQEGAGSGKVIILLPCPMSCEHDAPRLELLSCGRRLSSHSVQPAQAHPKSLSTSTNDQTTNALHRS